MEHWQILLEERGILKEALAVGWQPNGTGWLYPTFDAQGRKLAAPTGDPIQRWKAYDSANDTKYLWKPSGLGKDIPRYYYLPELRDAIQKAEGSLYLSSGEPDTLTFRASGAMNVLSWFGEGSTPDTLADDLLALGVQRIECWPDRDEQGLTWAKTIVQRLSDTLIDVLVYQLPGEMGSKYDINKHWIACKFDADEFWLTLGLTPELKIEVVSPEPIQPSLAPRSDFPDLPDAYYDAIAQRLGVTGYKANGYSFRIRCPMVNHEHDDSRPHAGWHKDMKHLKCFKCSTNGKVYLAKDVSAAIGVDFKDYLPKHAPVSKPAAQAKTETAPKPKVEVIKTWDSASQTVLAELSGEFSINAREPLPMPFAEIRKFGGIAKALPAEMVIGVAADSGHGKTSFVETLIDSWRRRGFSGMGWSPEWTAVNQVYRAVQRCGGPSAIASIEHKGWLLEAKRGIPENKRSNDHLDEEQIQTAKEKVLFINSWPGKYTLIDKMGLTVEEIIEHMREVVEKKIYGERMSFAVIDYAQLLNTAGEKAGDRIERATAAFKAFCVDYSLTGIVTTQVNKEAGREAANGAMLTQHGLQFMRGDYLNLLITLSREVDAATGKKSTIAKGNVAKNSLGRDGEFQLVLNETLLKWADPALMVPGRAS